MIRGPGVYPESTGEFGRWHFAERPVRTTLVVLHPPRLYNGSGVVERFKPVRIQASSRNVPLKASTNALSVGFPGRL